MRFNLIIIQQVIKEYVVKYSNVRNFLMRGKEKP